MSSEISQSFVNQVGVLWRVLNRAYGRELPERLENQRFCPQFWAVFTSYILFFGVPVAFGFLALWLSKREPLQFPLRLTALSAPVNSDVGLKVSGSLTFVALWIFLGAVFYRDGAISGWWIFLWGPPAIVGSVGIALSVMVGFVSGVIMAFQSNGSLGEGLRFLPTALWTGAKMLYKKVCPIVTYT